MTSPIFAKAAHDWQAMRADYETYVQYAYLRALREAGAFLVNKQGRAIQLDGIDLFTGPASRAHKYASEELLEHWKKYPRLSLEQYERDWMIGAQTWHETE